MRAATQEDDGRKESHRRKRIFRVSLVAVACFFGLAFLRYGTQMIDDLGDFIRVLLPGPPIHYRSDVVEVKVGQNVVGGALALLCQTHSLR